MDKGPPLNSSEQRVVDILLKWTALAPEDFAVSKQTFSFFLSFSLNLYSRIRRCGGTSCNSLSNPFSIGLVIRFSPRFTQPLANFSTHRPEKESSPSFATTTKSTSKYVSRESPCKLTKIHIRLAMSSCRVASLVTRMRQCFSERFCFTWTHPKDVLLELQERFCRAQN